MSLAQYKKKRQFSQTSEPDGSLEKSHPKKQLRFVVQKHAASHLHYDFRLEMDGVLKSWAIPKGPSMNPADKRLSVMVEDHPYEYKDFEGTIPEGNYGAGNVIIWDEGTYTPADPSVKNPEKKLPADLKKGQLSLVMHGHKLQGEFKLIKMPDKKNSKNAWLLIKRKDQFASTKDIRKQDKSVRSGKKIEEPQPSKKKPQETIQSKTSSKKISVKRTGKKTDEKMETVNSHSLTLTHLNKLYWPEDKYTKNDLIDYYKSVAHFILPHLKDRPQVLHRYPNGINGESFYQKNNEDLPDWIHSKKFHSESEDHDVNYLICQDEATLIYMVNLGCIEMNPWSARAQSPDNPDFCIIDLDPEAIDFYAVVQTAQVVHEVLEEIGASNYCKTSGKRGLHICIPLGAKYTFEQSRQFAQLIAAFAHQRLPKITSLERTPKKRQGKVYLDYLQNRHQQTIVAPYSARPKPKAPVSTPLSWEEVNNELSPQQFTIKTILKRLEEVGDLWKPVLGKGIDLLKCIENLEKIK